MVPIAERRMFAKTIVTSDAFLDMPPTARSLYMLLCVMADDDGFVNAPRSIMRMSGATEDDIKLLIAKRFVLIFESGVVVIKHWRIHNLIQKDRYKETKYLEEKSLLALDENNAYTEAETTMYPECIQPVSKLEPQVRLVKDSRGKSRVVEDNEDIVPDINVGNKAPKVVRHKYGMYENVLLTDEDYQKLREEFPHDYSERIERLSEYIASTGKKYKSHLATIRSWARKDTGAKPKSAPKASNPFLDLAKGDGYE